MDYEENSVILMGLAALLATGCAEESIDIARNDIYVTSFYNMGWSHTFGNMNLGINNSVSGQYFNEIMDSVKLSFRCKC